MKKTIVILTIIALTAVSAFAAGSEESGSSSEMEHLTISTNMTANVTLNFENDEMFNFVKDKYNVDFEFFQVSNTDWLEKLQIWIASGDMPDVMNWDFKYHHMPLYNEWVKLGALRAMPEDLSPYPNLTGRLLDKMTTDDLLMIDGKRYSLPRDRGYQYMPNEGLEYIWEAGHTLYRRDWAKEVGMYKENDIYTWDEMLEMAVAFIEQDPGNNGEGQTIGYVMHNFGILQGFLGIMQTFSDWAGYREGYLLKNGKYEWSGSQPGLIEGIKAWRRGVDTGAIWVDMPAAKGAAGLERYYAGEAGIAFSYMSQGAIRNTRDKFIDVHGMSIEESREATAPLHYRMPNGSLMAMPLDDYWSISIFSAKMSDAKMDRWLMVQDWNTTTEGNVSAQYGPKGKGWDFAADGSLEVLWEQDADGKYINPDYVVRGWNQFWAKAHDDTAFLNSADLRRRQLMVDDDVNPFLEQYKGNLDGYTPPDAYVKFFSGENFNKYGNFANDMSDKILEIVYSDIPYDGIEKAWMDYVASKMPQVQLVLDELNAGM